MASRYSKGRKVIDEIIKPFGYRVVIGKRHHKIVDGGGSCLLGFAGSPSEDHWYKNVINQLIKNGKLPGVRKI